MSQSFVWISVATTVFLLCAAVVLGQSPVSRCYHFTWLGPRYNNESVFMNSTCQDAIRLANGIPCSEPLVASYDGTWPDVYYIWEHHAMQATCVLAENDVCAQYTYYFNNRVENSTYMCTRALDGMEQAITRGCYEQVQGSYRTRVCFCRSIPGGMPCNKAYLNNSLSTTILAIALLTSFLRFQ